MSDSLAHLSDARLVASARRMSKTGRWLFLVTIVFITLGVWVDFRWFMMSALSAVLTTVALAASGAAIQELRERDPNFKWED